LMTSISGNVLWGPTDKAENGVSFAQVMIGSKITMGHLDPDVPTKTAFPRVNYSLW
jgi:hypothetical protein